MAKESSSPQGMLAAALVAALVALAVNGGFYFFGRDIGGSSAVSQAQKKDLEQTIRNYLVQNPEVLVEMQTVFERRQADARQEARQTAITENATDLFRPGDGLIAGNPDGDVTVVEFFDYNCGYCRRAFKDLAKLIETDKNVRVVLKEFPIFGEPSEAAARAAIAAQKQGKYFEMHRALLETPGRASKEKALEIAEKLGLDTDQLQKDMEAAEVDQVIKQTAALAEKMGLEGTPFYLVGDKAIPGAPENLYDLFVENVAEIRKNGCTATC